MPLSLLRTETNATFRALACVHASVMIHYHESSTDFINTKKKQNKHKTINNQFLVAALLVAQDHFRTSGEVERADVMMDSSRRSKGWGTVRFRTPVSVFVLRGCYVCVFGRRSAGCQLSGVMTDSGEKGFCVGLAKILGRNACFSTGEDNEWCLRPQQE